MSKLEEAKSLVHAVDHILNSPKIKCPACNGVGDKCTCIKFDAPHKFCRCGLLLPTNGDQKDEFGNAILDEHGNAEWRPSASLICEACAIDALAPLPKKPRKRKGAVDAAQEKFDVPTLEIR